MQALEGHTGGMGYSSFPLVLCLLLYVFFCAVKQMKLDNVKYDPSYAGLYNKNSEPGGHCMFCCFCLLTRVVSVVRCEDRHGEDVQNVER